MPTTTTTTTIQIISLENIQLSGLVVESDVSHTGVRADIAKTLAGGIVSWEVSEPSGRLIDLAGGEDFGWLSRSTLQSLQSLAAVPGATYTLTTPHEIITVRFRNEEGAISAKPIIARPNQAADDWYNSISIKLMEV